MVTLVLFSTKTCGFFKFDANSVSVSSPKIVIGEVLEEFDIENVK